MLEEFIKRQLDEIRALRQGGRTVSDYEINYSDMPHL
jgi:hypothetical protein